MQLEWEDVGYCYLSSHDIVIAETSWDRRHENANQMGKRVKNMEITEAM